MSPVLWLTPASDTTVNDTRVHGGYHHLALLKVRHQLTVAGIDGATLLGDPEVRNLAWGPTSMVEGDGRWRHPRYLSRRGGFHVRRYLCPWPPTIPVTPFHNGRASRSCQFSPDPDMHSDDHAHLVVDDGLLNRGFHKPICLSSHPGRSEGVLPFLPTCLHSIPTSANEAFGMGTILKTKGVSVLVGRRVVPTGPLANWETVRRAYFGQVLS
jgi:hypothetical protein